MKRRIEMRFYCDCMVACLAMLLDIDYDDAAQYFPERAIRLTGYRWEFLIPYLRANRIYLTAYDQPEILDLVDWAKPAMVDVPSLTAPDKGDHIIFWDGHRVIDPSPKVPRYTSLPEKIFAVYQLKSKVT